MKKKMSLVLGVVLALSLSLLTACGGGGDSSGSESSSARAQESSSANVKESSSKSSEDNGIVGLWESEEFGGICLELLDDGTGTIYTYNDMGDLTYEWDGEILTIMTVDEDDGELEETTGELQADGSIGIMGLGYFFPVDERSYGPDMEGSSFTETGGMESELEGDWVHSSGNLMLTFDGRSSVTFQELQEGGISSSSTGWYSYDGETVTVDLSSGVSEGYIDGEGDLIIEIQGEGGWYTQGDSSQLSYPDITGPEAELVDEWINSSTGDLVEFRSDGSVVYSIDGSVGASSSFTFDGEAVTFSDYTGYIDGDGDLIVDGLDGWFSRSGSSASEYSSDDDYSSSDSSYALEGAYDNDEMSYSIVFYSDGTFTLSSMEDSVECTYTLYDDGTLYIYIPGEGETEGQYDFSENRVYIDGMSGYFEEVSEAWYTP